MADRHRMLLALIVALALLALPHGVTAAHGFEVAVQDQGATPEELTSTAELLHLRTARIIVRPGEPQLRLVRAYRRAGLRVQAAIAVKRWHTPGDVRALLRAWHGDVQTVSIGNEPELNGLRPCAYAELYRRSYALVRREFPGVRIGFGEFSPSRAVEYSTAAASCPGSRLRADFWAWHAYQWQSDPLAPSGARQHGFWGIGDAAHVKRYLRSTATRKRLTTRSGRALPIRITEFAYLLSGRYAQPSAFAERMWPRAIAQARRHAEQIVIYGLGAVHEGSNWGSASLLDRFGRRLPALEAIARALGLRLPREQEPPPAPAGDLIGPLPDGTEHRELFVTAASIDTPEPLEEPVAPTPVADEPTPVVESPDVPTDPASPLAEDPQPEVEPVEIPDAA